MCFISFGYNTLTSCVWARFDVLLFFFGRYIINSPPSLWQANATFSIFLTDLYSPLSSGEILGTLTWHEHSNVHCGSFLQLCVRLQRRDASKNTERAIWLISCLMNIHSLPWRGQEVTLLMHVSRVYQDIEQSLCQLVTLNGNTALI